MQILSHLSESESSLEMEDERVFNELSMHGAIPPVPASAGATNRVQPNPASSPSAFGELTLL